MSAKLPSLGAEALRRPARRDQTGSNARRLVSNLLRDAEAMRMLDRYGIDTQSVRALELGMRDPFAKADGAMVERAVTYPVSVGFGRRRYAYLTLPRCTLHPEHAIGWGPGEPATVMAGRGEQVALVCVSALVAWSASLSADHSFGLTALATSQPGAVPKEWSDRAFWSRWERVVVAADVPTPVVNLISMARGSIVEMGEVHDGLDAYLAKDGNAAGWVRETLRTAVCQASVEDPVDLEVGDFMVEPVSVHGGFFDGLLLHAFCVERRELALQAGSPVLRHHYATLVVRSDGALMEAQALPSPTGTSRCQQVYALSDGTRIAALPVPAFHSSWPVSGVKRFVAALKAGENPRTVDGPRLAQDLHNHLETVVVLPDAKDLWILVAYVLATYVFRVFDAFPLLLLHGPQGCGKSELTSALADVSYNGVVLGQGSAAALIRLVADGGGLIGVDDAEVLAGGFGQLAQVLKQGYKKASALKRVASGQGRVEEIDFFGPRLICNTRGVDPILGSRCLKIEMAPAEGEVLASLATSELVPAQWRNDAHVFAMLDVRSVADSYERMRPKRRGRAAELLTPLLAVAEVIGHAGLSATLAMMDRATKS